MSGGFLFVSQPLAGHVNPIASVAAELTERGHRVAWAGSEAFLRPRVGPDATVYQIPLRVHGGGGERGLAGTKARWEGYVVPHAKATRSGIERAIAEFRPDVLAVDQHAIAGAVAACRHGLPWATLAPSTMELLRPYRRLPKVEAWIHQRMAAIWTEAGMPGEPPFDLRFSPHLVVSFLDRAILPDDSVLPDNTVLVGPALSHRRPSAGFPWEWLDPGRRHVLVTVGTLAMDLSGDFYRRVLDALRPLGDGVQAVVVAPERVLPDPPEHVLVRPSVPVLELMPHLDAVLCHGGAGTVGEALAHAVPLVLAPITNDQPITAGLVAASGAGVRVRFDAAPPLRLREALLAVLDDPSYRAAARRIQESFRAAGGARAAADHLEALARRSGAAGTGNERQPAMSGARPARHESAIGGKR